MGPRTRLLQVSVLLGGILAAPSGWAQAPDRAAVLPAPSKVETVAVDPLPGLPRPPDEPRSLLQPALPAPPYSCDPLPGPYFEHDPHLDPPEFPQPGWFAGVEVGVVVPHFKNRLTEMVQIGARPPDTVELPGASFDWNVSPRFAVGYRLPSGFGEFALSYRFLATHAPDQVPGPDGPAGLNSRLGLEVADLDYVSREFSLYPCCDMKWWVGIRLAALYFDSRLDEPLDEAAAGSGVFEMRTTNHYVGAGPHWGVELAHHLNQAGLSLMVRGDSAILLGQLRQGFFEIATVVDPITGAFQNGETRDRNPQGVPMVNGQVGLTCQPPQWPCASFFLGYEYEYWWNVGRLSTTTSRGELSDQGILVRAEFNF